MAQGFSSSSGLALPVSVANGGTGVTSSTGSGSVVLSTSPTLVTPALGTPASGTLTNCTGLPPAGVNFSGVLVYRSGAQAIATATFTKVQLNTETYDTQNTFDSVTNYRWTPNIAGKYLVIGSLYYSTPADGKIVYSTIYKNGSPLFSNLFHTGSATDASAVAVGVADMNGSTDYLELYAYHNHGSNRDVTAASFFNGYLIGT